MEAIRWFGSVGGVAVLLLLPILLGAGGAPDRPVDARDADAGLARSQSLDAGVRWTGFGRHAKAFTDLGGSDQQRDALDLSDDCVEPRDPACLIEALLGALLRSDRDGELGDVDAVEDAAAPRSCVAPGGPDVICRNGFRADVDSEGVYHYVTPPSSFIPEPGTGSLVGISLVGIGAMSRRRSRRNRLGGF